MYRLQLWNVFIAPQVGLQTLVQDEIQKTGTKKPAGLLCTNTKGTSTNIHKLKVQVDACCPYPMTSANMKSQAHDMRP